jgi:non-specific serine/threonine protein kinase
MPLALELAAPWIKVLNCQEIAAEIESSLDFLATSLQNVPERHRSLRVIFEQSWSRLSASEQAVLRQLSVFRGGCTREAAEQVTGATLVVLSSLMGNALLRRTSRGRYELHEMVRQYGAEKLAETGNELLATRQRHADYFLDFAEQSRPHLEEKSQAIWLDRLEREHDNLRAALTWSNTIERAEPGARLAEALSLFWLMRGYLAEGREQLAAFLRLLDEDAEPRLRARLLDRAGFLARYQGDFDSAYALIDEGLGICRRLGDDHATADALANLGYVVLRQSDLGQARALYAESLAIHRALNNRQGIADSLSHLALISSAEDDYEAAQHDAEESLDIWRDLGDKHGIAWALCILGLATFRQNDLTAANQHFKEGLKIAKEIDIKWEIALSLEGIARIAAARDQAAVALHLAAGAAALRETAGVPLSAMEQAEFESDLAPAYGALEEQASEAAWAAGQNLDLEELVLRALALDPDPV